MPTHGTPKSQIQDESQTQGVDFPKQWLGICQEEAKTWRVHKGVGRLLSPRQHETFPHENGRVAKATATYVYMEVVEEGENENCQLDKVWYS